MSPAIIQEIRLFLISAAFGILLGIAYDVFRIFRRLWIHGVWWVAAEDLLYFFCASLLVFSMIFAENDGTVRFFSLGSLIVGVILYYISVSPYLVRFFVWLIGFPFRFFARIVKKIKKILAKHGKVS